jgi:hypothetical protein
VTTAVLRMTTAEQSLDWPALCGNDSFWVSYLSIT